MKFDLFCLVLPSFFLFTLFYWFALSCLHQIYNVHVNLQCTCAVGICSPFHHVFTHCQCQQNIPLEWKTHCITPTLKSGEKALISNYRPISLYFYAPPRSLNRSFITKSLIFSQTLLLLTTNLAFLQITLLPTNSSFS